VDSVVIKLAKIFEFNPRRLKQFVNVFRLRVMIAILTNVLAPAVSSGRADTQQNGISLEQLGLFTAIILRWPRLISDLIENPQLLARLASDEGGPNGTEDYKSSGWERDGKLVEAVRLGGAYSLAGIDLRRLLMIMPDTYSGGGLFPVEQDRSIPAESGTFNVQGQPSAPPAGSRTRSAPRRPTPA
jgi:hypothetical protein